ncbi:MAG: hypothetical protein AAF716_01565 [Cyanobacteria bacterium P01_D01_bin.1]
MVDRPIKKSDREAAQQANPTDNQSTNDQAKDDQPKAARSTPKPIKKSDRTDGGRKSSDSQSDSGDRGRGGKGRGKGRGRGKDDAPKAPMNPALMRGPKPTKKVEVEEVAAEEVAAEEGIAAEGTEETTAAAAEETAPATPPDTDA